MLFLALICFSQSTTKFKKHKLEFYPISLTINKGFFVGQSIKYNYSFNTSIYVELNSDGVLTRKLDSRNNWFSQNEKFPIFNQSKFLVGYNFKNEKNNDENHAKNNFGTRIGYHYLQHGTQNGEYWQIDTTEYGEKVIISGFRTHSIIFGIQYKTDKLYEKSNSKIQRKSHRIYLDYVLGVSLLLKGNIVQQNHVTSTNINNNFKFQKNGFNLGYNFSHSLSSKLNIHVGLEFLWSPFIDYSPNYSFFVPRGGEKINPWFSNIKIGLGI